MYVLNNLFIRNIYGCNACKQIQNKLHIVLCRWVAVYWAINALISSVTTNQFYNKFREMLQRHNVL